jgi:MFS transporter, DHA3 family, macrolide efflux protein
MIVDEKKSKEGYHMRDSKYWSIMVSSALSSLGSSMYFIAVAWILYKLTHNATYTGLMVGMGFLPGVVLNLVFGVLVDKQNRKRLTVISIGIVTLSMALLLAAMSLHILKPWMIIAVHMLVQTFSSLFRTAQQAFITELYKKEDIPRIFSETGSAVSVGGLAGTSICGGMLTIFPASIVMLFVCLTFLICTVCMMLIKYEPKKVPSSDKSLKSGLIDLTDSFVYVHRHPLMYSLLLIMFVGQLVVHTGAGMLSVYTSSYLHGSSTLYGILESAASVGAIIAGVTATSFLYKSKYYVSGFSFAITSFGLVLMTLTRNNIMAFIAVLFIGLGTTWVRVLMQSVQQVYTEPAYYGRMAALRQTVNQGAVAIGAPILGWIAEHHGVNNAYGSLLIPVVALMVFSLFFASKHTFRNVVGSMIPQGQNIKS